MLALTQDFPRLWKAPTTEMRDRKRMLLLLIKDITVEKRDEPRQAMLHICWQGGACEDLRIDLPAPIGERKRYPREMVDRVRKLAAELPDAEMVEVLNQGGYRSHRGRPFTVGIIRSHRHGYGIPAGQGRRPGELNVREVAERFGVSRYMVYNWIQCGLTVPRSNASGSRFWITIEAEKEAELRAWVRRSARIKPASTPHSEGMS